MAKKPRPISGRDFRKMIQGKKILIRVTPGDLADRAFLQLVCNLFGLAQMGEVETATIEFTMKKRRKR